ncbi:hypothetical protein DFH08DRAFT_1080357 [Mycena albidolilacea]|uniref:Uncharacterized protein n=1 Tax=Mycena albidolilacea TaxID=1033008 RepID=A0AAD7A1U7_9AGAR|nr:hypothetical protein DFH08DRAFT_1080357 [Mycena albidolilacea]
MDKKKAEDEGQIFAEEHSHGQSHPALSCFAPTAERPRDDARSPTLRARSTIGRLLSVTLTYRFPIGKTFPITKTIALDTAFDVAKTVRARLVSLDPFPFLHPVLSPCASVHTNLSAHRRTRTYSCICARHCASAHAHFRALARVPVYRRIRIYRASAHAPAYQRIRIIYSASAPARQHRRIFRASALATAQAHKAIFMRARDTPEASPISSLHQVSFHLDILPYDPTFQVAKAPPTTQACSFDIESFHYTHKFFLDDCTSFGLRLARGSHVSKPRYLISTAATQPAVNLAAPSSATPTPRLPSRIVSFHHL